MAENDHSWSPLGFAEEQAVFKGPTQNVRALSEGWVAAHMFCPACGAERLRALPNNSPVGDFVCDACAEAFALKAKQTARWDRKSWTAPMASSPSAVRHPHEVPHLFWRYRRTQPKPSEGAAMESGISRRGA